ncbi:hypothetical protein NEPTK9_001599 [Candidatus Neptunochlamydia vexilliferae]|uniref:Uncharacterized protein n=1 Tax=Candidatus Neptunichlamydia vexilliferae TaxID=1651774 RepID=A0ABS0B104_9BACT|nr:hypothetical protein [Candidatus Neptunochlamydia vexilliferae]
MLINFTNEETLLLVEKATSITAIKKRVEIITLSFPLEHFSDSLMLNSFCH